MQAPAAAPTLLDRAIAALAPRVGVKRLIARQAFDGLDAARRGARDVSPAARAAVR